MKVSWKKEWRGFALLVLLMGAAAARAQAPAEPAATHNETQPNVVSVRIVNDEGRVLAEAPTGLPIELGKPLDRSKVAESLRTLYATGDYAELKAVVVPDEGGVRLDFVAQENLFFNQVRIEGLSEPPSESSAAAAMQLGLGQPYRKQSVDDGVERLRETLREEGLYQAQLSVETVPHVEMHQMDVIVHVKPGPRARIGAMELNNGTEYRDAEILSRLKLKQGREITSARVQKGTENVRKFLVKKGRLNGRAVVKRGEYDSEGNRIPLVVNVSEGPRVRLVVTGTKFSNGELRRLVPVYQEGAVDADLLEEGKRNIRERLERLGYFDATVDYTTEVHEAQTRGKGAVGSEETITYKVERGDRHKLLGIEITGNRFFSTELLRSRLQISAKAYATPGRYSRRLVDADALSMKNLYISNGFLNAKVEPQVKDDYKGKRGDLFIAFAVQEGKQTRVASLKIEGVHAFKENELLEVVGSTPGQAFSDYGVTADRDNILALYYNEGFPAASFTATVEPAAPQLASGTDGKEKERATGEKSPEKKLKEAGTEIEQTTPVKLVYHIVEGPQTRVRRIWIAGFARTRPGVIRREVRVKTNEPLREGEVVESQRRLYNLGVFNRVTIEPQNPNGTDADKDIVVLVEEAKRYTIAYGGGFEVQRLASTSNPTGGELRAAPRGILEVSKLNLTGRADSLSLKLRGSTLQGRALLLYSVPNTFASPHFSFQATAYAEKTRDINTFTEDRYEGSVQLTQLVTPRTSLLYRYSFRKVVVSSLNIAASEIPIFNAPTLVSQFGVTWVRDTRDNPADANKGSFNSADFAVADTGIGSSASFLRLFYQNSTYYPIKKRFSFARSIRFGVLSPYKNSVSLRFPTSTELQCVTPATAPGPTPELIPLPERFFGGGGTSLRGFALNQAGPRDSCTGFPVGGQALLVLNQEFRFPMRLPYVGTALGGALFYDGGNVYSRLSRISFRATLPRPVFTSTPDPKNPTGPPLTQCVTNCSNELNYFAHTVGFGLRYGTPVGPIRIDLGYPINRPFIVVPCVPITTNTQPQSNCFKGAQLPRLQVFFNLGASF
jgi:outer membrane protein insertion porin family